jgi:hypothetical protein
MEALTMESSGTIIFTALGGTCGAMDGALKATGGIIRWREKESSLGVMGEAIMGNI